jgi:alkylation response protein AidB-like acyl-CoA dehydrogenase
LITFATAQAADSAETEEDRKRVHAKAAMSKLYASEMANPVADHAVQIFGGGAICAITSPNATSGNYGSNASGKAPQ